MKQLLLTTAYLFLISGLLAQSSFDQKIRPPFQATPRHHLNPTVTHGAYSPLSPRARTYSSIPFYQNSYGALLDISHLRRSNQNGLPVFFEWDHISSHAGRAISTANLKTEIQQDLKALSPLLGLEEVENEFSILNHWTDDLNHRHVKLQQEYKGLAVYGGEIILHYQANKTLMTGRYQSSPKLEDLLPDVSAERAISTAIEHVRGQTTYRELVPREKEILKYEGPAAQLVVYLPEGQDQHVLAWEIELRPNFVYHWHYMIQAESGEILHAADHTCSLGPATANGNDLNGNPQTINVWEDGSQYYMLDVVRTMFNSNPQVGDPLNPQNGDGFILTGDMENTSMSSPSFTEVNSSNNSWTPTAISAHHNSAECYEYFRQTHQRSSINGVNGDIFSFINVADEGGGGLDNAFWNGEAMFYGNGGGAFTPLAGALDVAGHEMAHGVIQNTANLEYQGQSGALNESFADIFGVMIDRQDWALGEDVIPNTNTFPSGYLRDVSNPNNGYAAGSNPFSSPGYQPAKMAHIFTGSEDNGGVHINSGIVNYAFYKFCEGIGWDKNKAEKVYYRALSQYLTRSSQFIDCRLAVIQAAQDLYPADASIANAAAAAFDFVEIFDGQAGEYETEIQTNPGQDYIVSVDTDPFTFTTIYRSSTAGANYEALSETQPRTRMSITDDGQIGFFVGTDFQLRALAMNPANPQEQIVSQDPWWNVAVSKDGSKIAVTTPEVDSSIWVYDFNMAEWRRFMLYNPTFGENGETTGGVKYADALEWDYSGEFLMYDAFNQIPNPGDLDKEFWDVGFIHVWDQSSNMWGSGQITKLFSNLSEGISIGNAVFSKNSPHIIAFDVLDANANSGNGGYYLYTANIESGEVVEVYENNTLSYPSYSKEDDKILFNELDFFSDSLISYVPLAADKITPAGMVVNLIPDGKWGVWYTEGNRVLDLADESPLLSKLSAWPNPVSDKMQFAFHLESSGSVQWKVLDIMGRSTHLSGESGPLPLGIHRVDLDLGHLSGGMYLLQVQSGQQQQSLKILKE